MAFPILTEVSTHFSLNPKVHSVRSGKVRLGLVKVILVKIILGKILSIIKKVRKKL